MKINWKTVMFVAVVGMLLGLALSVWGVGQNNIKATYLGLLVIMAVCVSWWFWVMLIIRTVLVCTERTQSSLSDIKSVITEVKTIVNSLDSNTQR